MADYLEKRKRKIKAGLLMVGLLCFGLGMYGYVNGDILSVNGSAGGRELPIYCVQTDKKQVALSFDAAWGACKSATRECGK